jgi:hypothetical protein
LTYKLISESVTVSWMLKQRDSLVRDGGLHHYGRARSLSVSIFALVLFASHLMGTMAQMDVTYQ